MKYLKRFESIQTDIEYHKEVIKDIFQDMFDEYNMEEYNNTSDEYQALQDLTGSKIDEKQINPLLFSIYPTRGKKNVLSLEIFPFFSIPPEIVNKIDFSGHTKRLESLGYSVKFKWVSNATTTFVSSQSECKWVRILINYSQA